MAADMGMNIAGGAYNFGYHTGDAGGHSRVESGSAGNVAGSYSYIDANGDRRTVQYSAGPGGYQASGDVGVDRRTAAAAAALAAMAPKLPFQQHLSQLLPGTTPVLMHPPMCSSDLVDIWPSGKFSKAAVDIITGNGMCRN
ncbi:adult-specific rigid cuticular protein 11.9 [Caerostris extrusa]|uniref:Adult-specific rigid cuticular protein 11.9 n=1 Tax=Caerostris extrusa TaxID=172846 RepID=A0AAV4VL13_CAEEX|nr:adult-specific rigid cuticular protein 11.9 [Caerostris extrusa]